MKVELPEDLTALVNKRLSTGAFTDAEDVLRRALEAQDEEESWTEEERRALSAHIDRGLESAERGELFDAAAVQQDIENTKAKWLQDRRSRE
jgi:putative addiction module CopG family antidote